MRKLYLILLSLFVGLGGAYAQTTQGASSQSTQQRVKTMINGIVVDEAGEPIIGASIVIKGTSIGAPTGLDGRFLLGTHEPGIILQVSYIGYVTVEVPGGINMRIVLHSDATDVGEVVVTGMFTKAKESYTGAVRQVTSAELDRAGNRSVLTSLSNVDPSFNILTDLSIGSDPNMLPDINLRGDASLGSSVRDLQSDSRLQDKKNPNLPLFLLDGFEISLERMMDLNESLIESITILKDASATAMYGSRGANGIVVITTKVPKPGKLSVFYSGQLSVEAPDLTSYNLMNSFEKLDFERLAGLYSSDYAASEQVLLDLYDQRYLEAVRGVDTYWLKYPVHVGIGHKHNLRVDGGSEQFRYAVGAQYNNIEGAMKGSARNTFNGNVFVSYSYKNLTFQNDLQIADNKSYNSPYGDFSMWGKINSYYKPYDDEGNLVKVLEDYYYAGVGTNTVYNPLYDALLPSINETKYTEIKNNFMIEWQILPELNLRGRLSVETRNYRSDKYKSSAHTDFASYPESRYDERGSYEMIFEDKRGYETDITLSYNKTFNKVHQVYAGFRGELADKKKERYVFDGVGISNPTMDFMGMASSYKKNSSPGGYDEQERRLGATLNVNYTYDRRYFADLTGRLDGSSNYGADNRTAPFWSIGLGWNIHNEKFFNVNSLINMARVRTSYGTSGSQDFNPYQALRTYKDYGSVTYKGGAYGSYLQALGNEDLGWQKVNQIDVGFDLGMFNNRVEINFDYYNKITMDLLSEITIPSAGGFTSYKENVGEVKNSGIEVDLNTHLIRNSQKRIYWSVGVSFRYNKNRITKISNSLEALNNELLSEDMANPSFLFKEGHSTKTMYAVESLGIDPSNGKEILRKLDGTLTYDWDASDQIACGVKTPKYWGNISTLFRWKSISMNAIFAYNWGGQLYNSTLASKIENIKPYDNADKRAYYDRWQKPGDQVFFKAISESTSTGVNTTKATSRFVMNDKTLRMKTLKLTYDFEQSWIKNSKIEYLSLSASTEDLFVVSSIKQERGWTYPYSRKFYFTVTARF